jgi:hypothetical protein
MKKSLSLQEGSEREAALLEEARQLREQVLRHP